MRRYLVLAILASTSLSGCASFQEKRFAFAANKPDLDLADVSTYTADQNAIWEKFVVLSQSDPGRPTFYNDVVDAGLLYVDARCIRYLDALAWFTRAKDATSRQIGYVGTAAAAALAIENASKELLGLTPLGFTLLSNTVDNIGKGLLFELPPSSVKILVDEQRAVYRAQIAKTSYTNRAAALAAIQAYVAICLPVSIEAEVSEAVQNARFVPKESPAPAPAPTPSPTPGATPTPTPAPADPPPNTVPVVEQVPQG